MANELSDTAMSVGGGTDTPNPVPKTFMQSLEDKALEVIDWLKQAAEDEGVKLIAAGHGFIIGFLKHILHMDGS